MHKLCKLIFLRVKLGDNRKEDFDCVEDGNESSVGSSIKRKFRSKAELEQKLKDVLPHSRLMWISAKKGEGLDELMERVAMFVKKVKEVAAAGEKEEKEK